jgi:2'-5' RNA ligase
MYSSSGDTALVLLVPQADDLVERWQDPETREGMPAHITMLYPFIPEPRIRAQTHRDLTAISLSRAPLTITLHTVGRFPGVLWLDPDSPDCRALIAELLERWPAYVPYGRPDWEAIPHLTIWSGTDQETMRRAEQDVIEHLPLAARIEALTLMAFEGTTWRPRRHYTFGGEVAR